MCCIAAHGVSVPATICWCFARSSHSFSLPTLYKSFLTEDKERERERRELSERESASHTDLTSPDSIRLGSFDLSTTRRATAIKATPVTAVKKKHLTITRFLTVDMLPSIFRRRHEPEEITPIPGPLEQDLPGMQHLQHLQQFEKAHKLDPNLPIDDLNDVDAAIATGNAEKGIEIEHALMEDNSPYPEV